MGKTYKMQVCAGVMLKDTNTGELRYFKPSANVYLLEDVIVIDSEQTLQVAISYLIEKDLSEVIHNFRPNTKWQVVYITQIMYHCWLTDFALGANNCHDFLPEYVLKNRSIDTSFNYNGQGNTCMFVCLAQFMKNTHNTIESLTQGDDIDKPNESLQSDQQDKKKKKKRVSKSASNPHVKKTVQQLLSMWYRDCIIHNLHNQYPSASPSTFPGVQWEHISLFEDLFKVRVSIMELAPDGTAVARYKSTSEYKRILHMNMYNNHLSYIANLEEKEQK